MKEILGIGGALIDKIWPDKTKAAEAKATLMKLEQDGELNELKTKMSVMLAEAQSKDPWTSRARPMFMYVIYVMILFSIPMGILSAFSPDTAEAVAVGMKHWLGSIPPELWTTFGVGYSGYALARTIDKRKFK